MNRAAAQWYTHLLRKCPVKAAARSTLPLVLAPCCHPQITWETYAGRDWFAAPGPAAAAPKWRREDRYAFLAAACDLLRRRRAHRLHALAEEPPPRLSAPRPQPSGSATSSTTDSAAVARMHATRASSVPTRCHRSPATGT